MENTMTNNPELLDSSVSLQFNPQNVLEIREGCSTPEHLLKSRIFSKFLKKYKMEFIENLRTRKDNKLEVQGKMNFILDVSARDFLKILESDNALEESVAEKNIALVKFMDGGFHHFRNVTYSRLVRLHNEVITGDETPDSIKDLVTEKASSLSKLIMETRRLLLKKVDMETGVRRTVGMEAHPSVTAGEISGHYLNLPSDYVSLSSVPLTIAADIRTGVDYSTASNKRAYPFFELDHNPFKDVEFVPEDWTAVPLRVGAWLIVAYLHKSNGCIEIEAGLLNLFPFAETEDILSNRKPDGVFIFGCPSSTMDDLGYFWDEENELLVGLVPNLDECKYFGYGKKPILTLHNVLAIRAGDLPLHCGCTRYVCHFDESTNEPYITEMLVKADDMGRARLEADADGQTHMIFYGTETGAFACLDGFSEHAKMQMKGREIGYNNDSGSNARQIVPVATVSEVMTGHPLDGLMYNNNFNIIEEGAQTIHYDMPVMEAIEHFRKGERVAAGSTQTHRGKKEISYWANPFPLLEESDGTILHPDLHKKYMATEKKFTDVMEDLVAKKEMMVGVVNSQLMAGVYENNDDEDITRCGYKNREEIEQVGPVRLAGDMIEKIKSIASEKRIRAGGDAKSVSVTVALVGDSRTGKSETAEKMEGLLDLQLV
jgi:hypothetical protein